MQKTAEIGTLAQGAGRQQKENPVQPELNNVEQVNESLVLENDQELQDQISTSANDLNQVNEELDNEFDCPISYQVILTEVQVGSGEKPDTKIGDRFSPLFNELNVFEARKDALTYAAGLISLIDSEHRYGGVKFDSPSLAESKGDQNINLYDISVILIYDSTGQELTIYQNSLDPNEELLGNLEIEYRVLELLDYQTNKFFTVEQNGKIFRCINSRNGFVEFLDLDKYEALDQSAA